VVDLDIGLESSEGDVGSGDLPLEKKSRIVSVITPRSPDGAVVMSRRSETILEGIEGCGQPVEGPPLGLWVLERGDAVFNGRVRETLSTEDRRGAAATWRRKHIAYSCRTSVRYMADDRKIKHTTSTGATC
jgi:hypothetical protein